MQEPTYKKKSNYNVNKKVIWKKTGMSDHMKKEIKKNPNVKSLDSKHLKIPKKYSDNIVSLNNLQIPKLRYQKKIISINPSISNKQSEPSYKKINKQKEPEDRPEQSNYDDFPIFHKKQVNHVNNDLDYENLSKQAFTFYDPKSEKQDEIETPLEFPKNNQDIQKKIQKKSVKNTSDSYHFPPESSIRHQSMKEIRENLIISTDNGFGHDFFESRLDVEDINTSHNRYDHNGKPLTISGINKNLITNKSNLFFI